MALTEYPLKMHDFHLHDPFVLADADRKVYCLYNANYFDYRDVSHGWGRSVELYMSPDLVHFSRPRAVFDLENLSERVWFDDSDCPWAPEVHEYRGCYWMFVTLHSRRQPAIHPVDGSEWYRKRLIRDHRGVFVAVADNPAGPFAIMDPTLPVTPQDQMALDGTLAFDSDGSPWMIYAREWVQMFDGTIEALPLDRWNLAKAAGGSVRLWSASEGLWHKEEGDAPAGGWKSDFTGDTAVRKLAEGAPGFVTDGPFAERAPNGSLLCLWTSYSRGEYILAQAISRSGCVVGPWEQLPAIDHRDAGHAMIFRAFDGTMMLIMHTNMVRKDRSGVPLDSHGIIYEVAVTDDGFVLGRHREDLDGIADPNDDR